MRPRAAAETEDLRQPQAGQRGPGLRRPRHPEEVSGEEDDYNIINIIISCRSCTRVCPPTHGQWTAWAGWSSCTTDCLQFRRRSCSQPTPANGGRYCQGKDLASRNCSAAAASSCAVAGSSLPVLVHYQDTGAGEGGAAGGQLATSDLTLYIGLAVAFLVLVLVVFIIVRLLQRKRSPHTGYSLTSTGTQDTRSLQSFLAVSSVTIFGARTVH